MKLKKILKWTVNNPMELISAIGLVFSIVISSLNAITRYTIRWTWNPGTDITTLCFGWTVFCGAAAAYRRKMHYGIDVIVSHLPQKGRETIDIIMHILMLLGLIYALFLSIDLTRRVGGKVLPNTNISYKWFDSAAVVGFMYMVGSECRQLYQIFKASRKMPDSEGSRS